MRPTLVLIAGPTASGKSALALDLAERHRGSIINADASQVYRDLRILTARPTPADEARVEHRLFGTVDGALASSAAAWAVEARAAIAQVHGAGRLPILVGGTGLYLRTLLDGIAPVPAIAPAVRDAIRALPVADAHAALAREDPAAADRLAPTDASRIARALEVIRGTGRTLSAWQRERTGGIGTAIDLRPVVLLPDRAWLADRCDARAAAMLDGGAVEEVAALLARSDVPGDAPILRTIGVPQVADLLAGTRTRNQALDRLRLATRQYAKRQYTWFRHQPPPGWHRSGTLRRSEIETLLRI